MKSVLFLAFLLNSFVACGQDKATRPIEKISKNKTENPMDLTTIHHPQVRQAIAALQSNNKKAWFSYFTDDVVFTDDGNALNFKSFFDNAFDKKEKFLSLDKIENESTTVIGNFYAGQWGTFKVFFTFHQNSDGQFDRLDIGQIKK